MDWNTPAEDLASYFKFIGCDKYLAWDRFVIARGLKPEMSAKDFYIIYGRVSPAPLQTFHLPDDFKATHFDLLKGMLCQITVLESGVFSIVWFDGHTGSNPPCCPPEKERFIGIYD